MFKKNDVDEGTSRLNSQNSGAKILCSMGDVDVGMTVVVADVGSGSAEMTGGP
jgi:hypothetical protein